MGRNPRKGDAVSSTAPIEHPDRFFIDGSWATPSSAAKIDVIDSATAMHATASALLGTSD